MDYRVSMKIKTTLRRRGRREGARQRRTLVCGVWRTFSIPAPRSGIVPTFKRYLCGENPRKHSDAWSLKVRGGKGERG